MKTDRRANARIEARMVPLGAAVATALGAAVLASPASGQDGLTEEVIVTASRRATTVQELPFNIYAMSGAELEAQRLRDLADFARWVPGLTVVDQGGRSANRMTVRGLNVASLDASEFLNNSSGDTVQTYLGEIPLYVDLKMHDIERVEVLIGPQGTLYGAGTLGGAVRYIPRAPDTRVFSMDFHGDVFGVEHGGTGLEGDFTINVPLVADRVALRGSVGWLDDPGFIDYPYLVREPGVSDPEPDLSDPAAVAANLRREKDVNWEETVSGRIALLVRPSDRVETTFNYYFQDQEVGGRTVNHRAAFGTGRYESGHRFVEPNDRENSLLSVEVVADLGFAQLTSATGFSSFDEAGQRDQTDLLLDLADGDDSTHYEEFPSFVGYARERTDESRTSQEVRLVSAGTGPWSWIAGLFYNDHEIDVLSEEFTPGYPEFSDNILPTGDLEYRQTTHVRLTERAIFGEGTYAVTDRVALTLGGRLFDYDHEQSMSFEGPLAGFSGEPQGRTNDDGFLGKINLAFDVSDDVLAYVTISEGYRLGGVNTVPECDPSVQQTACASPDEILVEPDRTTNYEVGVHSALHGGRITLNAALFHIDWEDIRTTSRTEVGALQIAVNGGGARTRGLELAAALRTDGPWTFRASYAYADAELTMDAVGLVDQIDAFAGDRLAGTPEHQGSFYLTYFRPLPNGLRLDVDYGFTFTSDVLTKVGMRANGEKLGGYAVHGMSVGIGDGRWSASLYADNLFDKFAETGVRQDPSFIRDINGFSSRRYFRNVLRPRTVGIEFRYRMGE